MNTADTLYAEFENKINRIAILIFFTWIAIIFTTPVGEGDFFWHVKTGEWIWQHKALPTADPFSFTVKEINPFNPESERIPFLLKQYWLGQLVFYGIWSAAGEAGMVAFRSLCYTGILLFLYRWAAQLRTGIVPLLTVAAVGNVLRNYSNERPQLFGFILLPVLIYTLEQIRTAPELPPPRWPFFTLPLVMIAWSNCHGSFILGIVVIILYLVSHLFDCIRGGNKLPVRSLIVMSTAIIATLLNPNGFGAFKEFFALSSSYTSLVAEYISPIRLAYQHHLFDYSYWFLLTAAVLLLVFYCRRMATAHLLVMAALMGLSLTGTRYIPFFVIAVPLLCRYIPEWQPKKAIRLCNVLPLLIVLLLVATADYRNILKFRAERSFPAKASAFLNEVRPSGNMFNYIGWGGYLMCYNSYPVFIDGRTLVEDLLPVHNRVLAGQSWQAILDNYSINFMIIPGTDAISIQAYPLLLQLLGNDQWSLIYQDEIALILIRNSAANNQILGRFAMDRALLSSHIQARWKWQMTNDF